MKRLYGLAAGLLVLAAVDGCKHTAGPNWLHPGGAQSQQIQALRYDPFPENETGPAMAGVRPREFEKPPPETSRARWEKGGWGK